MQLSMKCSVAVHCLIFIHEYHGSAKVTSNLLSLSTGINPVVIRNILSGLKKAAMMHFTFWDSKKAMSCRAYCRMVSGLRLP